MQAVLQREDGDGLNHIACNEAAVNDLCHAPNVIDSVRHVWGEQQQQPLMHGRFKQRKKGCSEVMNLSALAIQTQKKRSKSQKNICHQRDHLLMLGQGFEEDQLVRDPLNLGGPGVVIDAPQHLAEYDLA